MTDSDSPPPPLQPLHHFPDYVSANSQLSQPRVSAAAVTSLVLGILGCIPAITSVLALIFGIVGIRVTSNGQMRGRGLAIAGLILGLVGIIGWGITSGAVMMFYRATQPVANVARQFLIDVAAGDVAAASKECSGTSAIDVQGVISQARSWGAFKDLTLNARNVHTFAGQTTWRMHGTAEFSNATRSVTFDLREETDGSVKIVNVTFR